LTTAALGHRYCLLDSTLIVSANRWEVSVSKQGNADALRNRLENGVLLAAAAILSLAIYQMKPFSTLAGRYVAFWIVLPALWLAAISFTRVAREFMLECYDALGTTPRRVVAGGAIGAAFILYAGIITSNIPDRQTTRETPAVTSLALIR
jgi:hypothetical protein